MSRDVPDIVVFALVVAVAISAVAVPVSALDGSTTAATVAGGERVAQQTADGASGTNDSASNESNETVAPGQRLAGVVGVQGAELDGEIEDRELEQRVASADSNDSKAAVVATELNTARERLQTIQERRDQLREARQSGEMSSGEYRARMAVTAAQVQSLQRQLNTSERVSRDLPDAALEARGVNRTEIDQLRRNTDELTGPEIAEIARDIAGNGSGPGPAGRADSARRTAGSGPPDEASERRGNPPENPGAGRDNASNATQMPNTPPNQSSNRASNRSSNRSTTGSPNAAGQPEEAGSGKSGGAGESGPPDDAGRADDGGNANDESGANDAEEDGGSDGAGDSGNSNSAENSGNGDNSDNAGGNSDSAGNSNDDGNSGNVGNSGNGDNSDNAGGGRP